MSPEKFDDLGFGGSQAFFSSPFHSEIESDSSSPFTTISSPKLFSENPPKSKQNILAFGL